MNGEVLRWIKNRYDYVKNYWRDSFPSLYFHFCKNYDIVGLRRLEWNLWATSIMYLIWWNMLKISVSRFILKKAILFIYSLLKWTSNFRFTWHSQKALFSIFIFEKNQRCIQSKFFSGIEIYYQWTECITWTPIPKKGNAKLFQCNVLSLTSFAWR